MPVCHGEVRDGGSVCCRLRAVVFEACCYKAAVHQQVLAEVSAPMIDFKIGDLVMDKDVFEDGIDLALVVETPDIAGYYKVYYCTGAVAGEMVLETVHAMQNFKVVSRTEGGEDD